MKHGARQSLSKVNGNKTEHVLDNFPDERCLDDRAVWSAVAQIIGLSPLELIEFFFQAAFSTAQVAD